MTSQEHNKFVAAAFFVYGCMQAMVSILIGFFMLAFMAAIPEREAVEFPPFAIFGIVMMVVILIQMAFAMPSFIAAYALWKRKSWAKPAGLVGAVLAAIHFPIGTGVCAYAFWFLLGDAGKEIYPTKQQSFQVSDYGANRVYEREYTPPPQPPNLWE